MLGAKDAYGRNSIGTVGAGDAEFRETAKQELGRQPVRL